MTNGEAVNWLINISADIGKAKHSDLWHYEQALSEIREMLETAKPEIVRCKDCKYHDENGRRISVRWLPCMDVRTGSNWFCGSAERREE